MIEVFLNFPFPGTWLLSVVLFCLVRIAIYYRFVIPGFRCDVDEICILLGHYAASSGNPLPTFQDNVWIPSSRAKNSFEDP
jgi:hypothetical protein